MDLTVSAVRQSLKEAAAYMAGLCLLISSGC